VDSSGATLDFLLSAAAKRFLAKALGRQNHPVPRVINTDGHSAGNDADTSLQNREYGTDLAEIKYLNSFRDPGR